MRTSTTLASSSLLHSMWSTALSSRSSPPTLRRSSPVKYERTAAAQVDGLADVERPVAGVAEHVHARAPRQPVGEGQLAQLGMPADPRQGQQVIEAEHAERAGPLEQRVQHLDCRPRIVECAVGRLVRDAEVIRERREPAVGDLVADESSGQARTCRRRRWQIGDGRGAPSRLAGSAGRTPRCARTMTASPTKPTNGSSTASTRGAGTTIACVIPVITVMEGGMATPGLTSVWNVPSSSPPRTFTAPTSVISHVAGEAPVVSRSRTTNVTSASGVPRSSNDRCRIAAL